MLTDESNTKIMESKKNFNEAYRSEFSTEIQSKKSHHLGLSDHELRYINAEMKAKLVKWNEILANDSKLAEMWNEIRHLNRALAIQEVRIATLMREKSEIIKVAKAHEKEIKNYWKDYFKRKSANA